MTADLEAVTRTLAEEMWADFREMYPGVECTLDMAKYEEPWVQGERHTILALAARLAPVLASLPDDRLAEAEAKVQRVEKLCDFDPDDLYHAVVEGDDTDHPDECGGCIATEIRAALSGGDATADRNFAHCTQHAAHDVDCSWCRTAEQDLARALGEEASR